MNFVCLWIDSPGGSARRRHAAGRISSPSISIRQVRTVAYIPEQARADAALVALACDQFVMHPRAVLGGPGRLRDVARRNQLASRTIRKELAPRKAAPGRCWRR